MGTSTTRPASVPRWREARVLRGHHPVEGGSDQEVLQGEDMLAAALEVGLPWFIFASWRRPKRRRARLQEQGPHRGSLRDSGLAWTVIAPSYFYENVTGAAREIGEGRLSLAMPADVPLQQVGLRDLGALVFAVLSREAEHVGRRVEVAADAPTPEDMAEALGVRFEERPIDELAARNQDLAAMYGSSAPAATTSTSRRSSGPTPRSPGRASPTGPRRADRQHA